jgi:pimeloyl-ACP methyl ester carboxylesterase
MDFSPKLIQQGFARCAIAACVIALASACDTDKARETAKVQGQAGALHVDDGGDGAGLPVVFIHSFGGNTTHWSEQLAHLRSERQAVAFDLRGHGRSEAPATDDYAVESLAADIEAVVDELELDRFVLVGHSMGGSAASAYVGAHPERVAGLLLVGASGKSDPAIAEQVLTSLDADYDDRMEQYTNSLLTDAKPAVAARTRTELARVPRDEALAIIGAVFAYDPLPALQAYSGPILIVDTSHGDGPMALHNQLPDIPREVINGTSHWPQLDRPDAFDPLLDRLIAEAEATHRIR